MVSGQLQRVFGGTQYLFPIFFVAAAIYIAINICVSRIAVWIEQRGSKKATGRTAPASPAAAVREGASVAK
jgi:glutamate transport system permease protein